MPQLDEPIPDPLTMDQKMDIIIHHLERIDSRDRLRMWGSFFRSMLAIIPMIFFLWSTWYLYAHFDDIMSTVMQQTAKSAAQSTGQSYDEILKQIREAMGGGQ